jgi:FkbM family methyltransferase
MAIMGIYQEKYTREYFTGVDKDGVPVGYGAEKETDNEGIWQLRSHDRKILELIDFKGKQVLDIGFGRGEAICHAYLNGATLCVGVDFADVALNLATELIAKRQLPEAQLHQSDAYTFVCEYAEKVFDRKSKKFDIVIMLDFVEHIPRAELRKMLDRLKDIITTNAILVLNTPEYKYDNDVIQNGFDERNLEDCYDTTDIVPETKGMHCNKYTVISLQNYMSECGYINISEAHYFVNKSLFGEKAESIKLIAYSERWRYARELKTPLKNEYLDDITEYPYRNIKPHVYFKFDQGNMSDLTLLLAKNFREIAFPGGNCDAELFASLKPEEIENKTIFEVGAFMGVNSLLFAKSSGPQGKVIAFEPNPWNRNRIFINLSHNQNFAQRIEVYDYALGDINDVSSMTMSSEIDKGYSSTSRISVSHPKIKNEALPPGFFDVEVNIRTLDWFVETTGIVPDVIKIDIEGAEYSLLRGGLRTLQENRSILFIELHSEFCALQCSMLLQDLGYQILVLKEEMDNRLMIKAVSGFQNTYNSLASNQNRYLDVISNQYEIVLQLQRFYNKELSEHHTLEIQLQNLQTEYQSLQAEDQTVRGQYQALQADHQTLQGEYQSLITEHQALQAEDQTVRGQYQALQADHQTLQGEYQSLITEHQAMQTEHQALQAENQALQMEYQAFQGKSQASQAEHQALQEENQSLQTGHQALQVEYQTLRAEYQSLQTEYQASQVKSQAIHAEHQSLQRELQALQGENQTLQGEYQAVLKSKSVRVSNQFKRILSNVGIKKYKQ